MVPSIDYALKNKKDSVPGAIGGAVVGNWVAGQPGQIAGALVGGAFPALTDAAAAFMDWLYKHKIAWQTLLLIAAASRMMFATAAGYGDNADVYDAFLKTDPAFSTNGLTSFVMLFSEMPLNLSQALLHIVNMCAYRVLFNSYFMVRYARAGGKSIWSSFQFSNMLSWTSMSAAYEFARQWLREIKAKAMNQAQVIKSFVALYTSEKVNSKAKMFAFFALTWWWSTAGGVAGLHQVSLEVGYTAALYSVGSIAFWAWAQVQEAKLGFSVKNYNLSLPDLLAYGKSSLLKQIEKNPSQVTTTKKVLLKRSLKLGQKYGAAQKHCSKQSQIQNHCAGPFVSQKNIRQYQPDKYFYVSVSSYI